MSEPWEVLPPQHEKSEWRTLVDGKNGSVGTVLKEYAGIIVKAINSFDSSQSLVREQAETIKGLESRVSSQDEAIRVLRETIEAVLKARTDFWDTYVGDVIRRELTTALLATAKKGGQ